MNLTEMNHRRSSVPEGLQAPETMALTGRGSCGARTVLVVEDERSVCEVIGRLLERAGFVVLLATNGDEALARARRHPGRIDLILTDVVMPLMSGPMLVRKLLRSRSTASVLYMSGYPRQHVFERTGIRTENVDFIPKPFTCEQLVESVDAVLTAARARFATPPASPIAGADAARIYTSNGLARWH
jgi:CheY-like chemotaxis protein